MSRRHVSKRDVGSHGFTLVELLVVIGIIAVLIAILLPALNSARRQAVSATCLSNLRSIGQAFYLYGTDHKGTWPVVQDYTTTTLPPRYAGQLRDGRWNILLLPYMTSPGDAANFSITYGAPMASNIQVLAGPGLGAYTYTAIFCPASQEFKLNVAEAIYAVQCGYGMNKMPLNSRTYPPAGTLDSNYHSLATPTGSNVARILPNSNGNGSWFKQTDWNKLGAERILIADARSFALDVYPTHLPETDPRSRQSVGYSGDTNNNDNQADRYRHGTSTMDTSVVPNRLNGKVAYNALYCDGHAATLTTIEDLFVGVRMRLTP